MSWSQKPTETISLCHFTFGANESSQLCSLRSAKSTSFRPYGITPRLIIGCLALHYADIASYQIHSGDLRPSTWQPFLPNQAASCLCDSLFFRPGGGVFRNGNPLHSRTLWPKADIRAGGEEREHFWWHVEIISIINYSYIFRIGSPDKTTVFSNTNLILVWQFWGWHFVDSNLSIWDGPEDEPCPVTRSSNAV